MGFTTLRVSNELSERFNGIKNSMNFKTQEEVMNYLCDVHDMFYTNQQSKLNELPTACLKILNDLKNVGPTIMELQLRKLVEVLDDYSRKNNVRLPKQR